MNDDAEQDRAPQGPTWAHQGPEPPPQAWTRPGVLPFIPSSVERWTREWSTGESDVALVGGEGREGKPFVVEIRAALTTDRVEALYSALAAATLRGAFFTGWYISGADAPDVFRVVQAGAVAGSPAETRFNLSAGLSGPGPSSLDQLPKLPES